MPRFAHESGGFNDGVHSDAQSYFKPDCPNDYQDEGPDDYSEQYNDQPSEYSNQHSNQYSNQRNDYYNVAPHRTRQRQFPSSNIYIIKIGTAN